MSKRQKYFYIAIVIFLVLMYAAIVTLFFLPSETERPQPLPTPTRVQPSPAPLDVVKEQAEKGIPLTPQEAVLRQQLIQEADSTGYIYRETVFSVVYLKDLDTFQIRLTSFPLDAAQEDSLAWLRSQGFSNNGICKLPILFYVNQRTLAPNQEFNPIPEGCQ